MCVLSGPAASAAIKRSAARRTPFDSLSSLAAITEPPVAEANRELTSKRIALAEQPSLTASAGASGFRPRAGREPPLAATALASSETLARGHGARLVLQAQEKC